MCGPPTVNDFEVMSGWAQYTIHFTLNDNPTGFPSPARSQLTAMVIAVFPSRKTFTWASLPGHDFASAPPQESTCTGSEGKPTMGSQKI
jgi:hypothetical protein